MSYNFGTKDVPFHSFGIMGMTLPGGDNPAIAIAASRAGAVGILNLEYAHDSAQASISLEKLARYGRGWLGVKLHSPDAEFIDKLIFPEAVNCVVLTPTDENRLMQLVRHFHSKNCHVFLETTCVEEASLGARTQVDVLIAKGYEAGGRIGTETTFILLQRLLAETQLPIWVQGGIGLHTAPACYVAGASGAVLDAQLTLTRESPLPIPFKHAISRMDGSETICIGEAAGECYRVYYRHDLQKVNTLRTLIDTSLTTESAPNSPDLRATLFQNSSWEDIENNIWAIGQDACFAARLAARHVTVGGVVQAFQTAVSDHTQISLAASSLGENTPLATLHGTRYPILQGPMTRVSDRPAFAAEVAKAGALPFLALALMSADEVDSLLRKTHDELGDLPWGVGILGFIPPQLRQEQIDVIRRHRPPFALIAGGRPDQALDLDEVGSVTYLHVPSPNLVKSFIEAGARRFVFEGSECGGHVGPRTSFCLWNSMIDTLLEALPPAELAACHVVFAGGIHDALSAAMVAVIAASLSKAGVKVGFLLGTAYLFTEEIVSTGAVVEGFQAEALQCSETVLLETGVGHASRCAKTPYTETFRAEKHRLTHLGVSADDARTELENLNLGRLRIAAKGINRNQAYDGSAHISKYISLDGEAQRDQGMYMLGQVAALRRTRCTLAELHDSICRQSLERLQPFMNQQSSRTNTAKQVQPSDIAIIGMACLLPKAPTLKAYWNNILNKVDAITEVPEERWDWRRYFDADPQKRDKIYSKWGGFLDPISFDPMRYGMPPKSLSSIEPLQLLTLEVVRAALEDAGYTERPFARQRTSVILGTGGGIGDLGNQYAVRSALPSLFDNLDSNVLSILPEWTEDSFAGILLNVTAGRVANRFDLGGVNFTVDAACASSLAAIYEATRELETNSSDMVIVGGVDTFQTPFGYLCFAKTQALSPNGRCKTFDDAADGIAISEGLAILVLKRLKDAERDGDRIYAVIKAVAGSSDGNGKSLTAPRPEGQALAVERAYAKAGFSPATVGLVEAHGTGTVAGDQAEVQTLKHVFQNEGAELQSCAIGSVKSMIGHTKCAAGSAGMIKIALALHNKILPPTMNVEKPNTKIGFSESPFYVNTETRPWLQNGHPRRAAVSAFGFGGTNFHAVLEEYAGEFNDSANNASTEHLASELFLWTASTTEQLGEKIGALRSTLAAGAKPALAALSYSVYKTAVAQAGMKLAIIANSLDDLQQKLAFAAQAIHSQNEIHDPQGVYFRRQALEGKVAFLFPGQGSQYPNMARDLCLMFPMIRECFERADQTLSDKFPKTLSAYIFPKPVFSPDEEKQNKQELTRTEIAQPALGAVEVGLLSLLQAFSITPSMVAGHSYGEYVALYAAGAYDEATLLRLSEQRGRCIVDAARSDLGTMAAVAADKDQVGDALHNLEDVWIANVNAPQQTVISGTHKAVERAVEILQQQFVCRMLPVACAFHSPLISPAQALFDDVLSGVSFNDLNIDTYSNTSGSLYPTSPDAVQKNLSEHLLRPVLFAQEIEAMYRAGGRIFIEVGPRNVLTNLVDQILDERAHLATTMDMPGRDGKSQLCHLLGQIAVAGVPLQLAPLYSEEIQEIPNPSRVSEPAQPARSATTWLVNGGAARQSEASTTMSTSKNGVPPQTPTTAKSESAMLPIQQPQPSPKPEAAMPTVQQQQPSLKPEAAPLLRQNGNAENTDQVMAQFQSLMSQFLDTQRQIMLAYLQGDSPVLDLPSASHRQVTEYSSAEFIDVKAEEKEPAAIPAQSSASEPQPEPPAQKQPELTQERVLEYLIIMTSERTGYPPEMLDLDRDIEGGLGIDSIKRVEILSNLLRTHLSANQPQVRSVMDQLTKVRTLRELSQRIWEVASSESSTSAIAPEQLASPQLPITHSNGVQHKLQQMKWSAVELPLQSNHLQFKPGSTFLITDDGLGVAEGIADRLRELGGTAIIARMGDSLTERSPNDYTACLTSFTDVETLGRLISERHQPLSGIIHLLPMSFSRRFEQMSLDEWKQSTDFHVKSLFYLLKTMPLKSTSADEQVWVISGVEGSSEDVASPAFSQSPAAAGTSGLTKVLAAERPDFICRTINFSSEQETSFRVDRILDEMAVVGDPVEISYHASRRFTFQAAPSREGGEAIAIHPEDVILITGGARGITAEIALELAAQYHPTLILVGRTPQPNPEESSRTSLLTSPEALRASLLAEARQSGKIPSPAEIEVSVRKIITEREIRGNLEKMRALGATVHYYAVDVSQPDSFKIFLEQIYHQHGDLTGVIHGAGIAQDKLIEDKTNASFDQVFDTKAMSGFVLSHTLRPGRLKFLIFFSSLAGLYGNRGQCDYAAANEVLNKIACNLDHRWHGKILSMNWGPWDAVGMVSEGVREQFIQRGISLINPADGRAAFLKTLQSNPKGDVELLVGSQGWEQAIPRQRKPTPVQLPLRQAEVSLSLNTVEDIYLIDHVLDGKPVLPAAMAAELMAETAASLQPELQVTGLSALRVFSGVRVDNGTQPIRIRAQLLSPTNSDRETNIETSLYATSSQPAYQATVHLSKTFPKPPQFDENLLVGLQAFPLSVQEAYEQWLFHGPRFQQIVSIDGFNDKSIVGVLRPSQPSDFLRETRLKSWIVDPALFDCAFQFAILWKRAHDDMTPLPSRFARCQRFGEFPQTPIRCYLEIVSNTDTALLITNISFFDTAGRMLATLEGMEFACDRSLNRLASASRLNGYH